MGQTHNNYSQSSQLRQFKVIKINGKGHTLLKHNKDGTEYLLRSFSLSCQEEAKDFMQLLGKRKSVSSINLLQVIQSSKRIEKQMCGVNHHIHLLVQHPFRNLQSEFQEKKDKISNNRRIIPKKSFLKVKSKQEYFSEQELLSILYSCAIALKQLYQNGLRHECLRTSIIFLDQNGLVKLGDPILLGLEENYAIMLRQQFIRKKQKQKAMEYLVRTTEMLNERKNGINNKNYNGISLCQKSKEQMQIFSQFSSNSQQMIKSKSYIDKYENTQEHIHLSPQLLHFIENNTFYCYEKEKSDIFILGCILLEVALLKNINLFLQSGNSVIFNYQHALEQLMNLYPPKNKEYGIYGLIKQLIKYQPHERPSLKKLIQMIQKQSINQLQKKQQKNKRQDQNKFQSSLPNHPTNKPYDHGYQTKNLISPAHLPKNYSYSVQSNYTPTQMPAKIIHQQKYVHAPLNFSSIHNFKSSPPKKYLPAKKQPVIIQRVEQEGYSYKSWYLNNSDINSLKWDFIRNKVENTRMQFPNIVPNKLNNQSLNQYYNPNTNNSLKYSEEIKQKQSFYYQKPPSSGKQNNFYQLFDIPKNQQLLEKLNSYPSLKKSLNVTLLSSDYILHDKQLPARLSDCIIQKEQQSGLLLAQTLKTSQIQKKNFERISEEKQRQSESNQDILYRQKITFGISSESNQQINRTNSLTITSQNLQRVSENITQGRKQIKFSQSNQLQEKDKNQHPIVFFQEFKIQELKKKQRTKKDNQNTSFDLIQQSNQKEQKELKCSKNVTSNRKIQTSSPQFKKHASNLPSSLKKFISAQQFMSQPVVQSQQLDGKHSSQIIGVSLQIARRSCSLKQAFSGMVKNQLPPPPILSEEQQKKFHSLKDIDMSKKFELIKSQDSFYDVKNQINDGQQNILNLNEHYIMAQSQALSLPDANFNQQKLNNSWSNTSQIIQQEFSNEQDTVSIKLQKVDPQQYHKQKQLDPIEFYDQNSSIQQIQHQNNRNSFQTQQKIINCSQNWPNSHKSYQIYKQSPIQKLGLNNQEQQQKKSKFQQDPINQQESEKQLTIIMEDSKQHKNSFFQSDTPDRNKTPTLLKHQLSSEGGSSNNLNQEFNYVQEVYSDGSCYTGTTLNGKRHGRGKMVFENGGCYDGQWKASKMNGYGRLFYESGKLAYQGEWKNDQFNGQGCVYNENPDQFSLELYIDPITKKQYKQYKSFGGRDFRLLQDRWVKYQGSFLTDFKHGKGVITLSNGQIFEGQFQYDVVQGKGLFHKLTGEIMEAYWKENIYQEAKNQQQ